MITWLMLWVYIVYLECSRSCPEIPPYSLKAKTVKYLRKLIACLRKWFVWNVEVPKPIVRVYKPDATKFKGYCKWLSMN